MEILFILLPLGIILLGIGIWAFFWAVKNDQFEDMEGPAYSILFDEDEKPTSDKQPSSTNDDTNTSTTPQESNK